MCLSGGDKNEQMAVGRLLELTSRGIACLAVNNIDAPYNTLYIKKHIYKMNILFADLSHSDTRLSVMLNGFELHVYNRCELYGYLENVFGLEPQMFPRDDESSGSSGVESKKGVLLCVMYIIVLTYFQIVILFFSK